MESRSGVELDDDEEANESEDNGVEVVAVVDAFVEATDCVVVEVGVVLEADSGVDVVEIATVGVDDGVEILDEEDCVRSVDVEEDAVLEAETDIVEEGVTSGDVEATTGEDEGVVKSEEEEVDDDDWSRDREVVASD